MATVVKGGTAYTGVSGTVTTHTNEDFSRMFAEMVFNSTPVLKAMGVRAWNGTDNFGNVQKTSGKGVVFGDGFQFSGKLAVSAPSATVLSKGGTVQAAERDDWEGWAYDWVRLMVTLGIPEEDIQDNTGSARLASLLADEFRLGNMGMIEAVSQVFLGGTSAPTGATAIGLPYLVSKTDNAIGGITASATRTWWRPWDKDLTDVGGGGDYDKPIALKRALEGAIVGTTGFASASGPDLLISNAGAYLTLARLSERLEGLISTTQVEKKFYDAGIPHMMVNGRPMVFDNAAVTTNGGTAGDFIYGIDTGVTGISFKRQEYFRVEKWMPPNARSSQRTYRSNIFTRMTPYVKDRRANFIIHGMTANTEATAD